MKREQDKSTILVITLGFLGVYLLFNKDWAIYTSMVIGCLGAFSNSAAKLIAEIWNRISFVLSKVMPSLLLAFIFYALLCPLALISRLFTNDPLLLKDKYDSTFQDATAKNVKENMENMW